MHTGNRFSSSPASATHICLVTPSQASPVVPGKRVPIDLPWILRELRCKRDAAADAMQGVHLGERGPICAAVQTPRFFQRQREWAESLRRSILQLHRAGENLFIDYWQDQPSWHREGDRWRRIGARGETVLGPQRAMVLRRSAVSFFFEQ